MRKEKNTKKQLHNKKCRAVVGCLASLLLLCLAGGILFAKYYAGRSNKGVATASSLYFSSNLLKNVQKLNENDYPVVYNTAAWDGTYAYSYNLEIRNYQNQLLYNDQNLDIQYDINFQLVNETDGGTYQVTYQNETKTITYGTSCSFSATLEGGQATVNKFIVSINRPEGNVDTNYKSVGVQVTATPVSPSYVANYEKLGGVLYATTFSSRYELKGEFSKVQTGKVSGYAGFPYTITYKPGEDNMAQRVKISWDASKLQLDKYCPHYSSIQTDAVNNREYIVLSIEPYTIFDINFFRTSEFDKTTTLEGLNGLVKIEKQEGDVE